MQPIHCTHNGAPEWMNAAVLFMTQYPFTEGKTEQRGEKCRTPVTISAPVSEVVLLSRTFSFLFFHSLSACLLCDEADFFLFLFLHSSLCLLTSGEKCWVGFRIPLRLADSQSLFVFVAPARESGHGQRENSCWQTDEAWTLIESESDIIGTHFRPETSRCGF